MGKRGERHVTISLTKNSTAVKVTLNLLNYGPHAQVIQPNGCTVYRLKAKLPHGHVLKKKS